MSLTDEQVRLLEGSLTADRVKSRDQSGRKVSYIEGYDVIDTANRIFGFDGWSYRTVSVGRIGGEDRRAVYQAIVEVTVGQASRGDVGIGVSAGESSEAQDTAVKGAVTDAMKRAFRSFGAQFGNSLYDKDGPDIVAPHCAKHDADMQQGKSGKWGHVLADGKPCFGEAA